MKRSRISAILGAGAVAAALASTAFAADTQFASVRNITVQGQVDRMVVPDEAHIVLQVSALNAKLATAKAEHDEKLKKVIGIAKDAGVEEKKIRTESSSVQPQYTYENNKRSFKGYRVITSLDITVAKTESLGGLMEKLSSAGLEDKTDTEWMGLMNVRYSIRNPEKIRDEMTAEAIQNARLKAERMAGAAGAQLGTVLQITEGNVPQFNIPPRPMPMMAMAKGMAMDANAEASAPPAGEQQLNASVTVTYELK